MPSAFAVERRAAIAASLALLLFGGLSLFALIGWIFGWFYGAPTPLNWKGFLATSCGFFAFFVSALVWMRPVRTHALLGVAVMTAPLVRLGLPGQWTTASFALLAATFLLLMPVLHAALVLPRK
jgi:hypothetical protein